MSAPTLKWIAYGVLLALIVTVAFGGITGAG